MARVKIVYAIQRMNLLPIFNKERTQRSIQLWNLAKAEPEALPPRERAETKRRLNQGRSPVRTANQGEDPAFHRPWFRMAHPR